MIAMPALRLRDGSCVEMATGAYDPAIFRSPEPADVALAWSQLGFRSLHVIDLNAVSGRGDNTAAVHDILRATDAEVQVGGGIRSTSAVQETVNAGAHRVVVGKRAMEDPDWLAEMAALFPAQMVVAADVRDRKILSQGWTRSHPRLVLDLVEELNELPLAALLVTTMERDDSGRGIDLPLFEDLAEIAHFPIFVAAELASLARLRALADRGVAATVIGAPLYSGVIDPRAVADEFSDEAVSF